MFVKRLCDNAESELHTITDKGLNHENLDMAYKLMDIYKNCKKVMMMEEPQKQSQRMSSVEEKRFEFINELEGILMEAGPEEKDEIQGYITRLKSV